MSTNKELERIRAKAAQHERAYQRIAELQTKADSGVWGLEDTGELVELNRDLDDNGFTLADVKILLAIIDAAQAVDDRTRMDSSGQVVLLAGAALAIARLHDALEGG